MSTCQGYGSVCKMNYIPSDRIVNIAGNVRAADIPDGKIVNIAGNVDLTGCGSAPCVQKVYKPKEVYKYRKYHKYSKIAAISAAKAISHA